MHYTKQEDSKFPKVIKISYIPRNQPRNYFITIVIKDHRYCISYKISNKECMKEIKGLIWMIITRIKKTPGLKTRGDY